MNVNAIAAERCRTLISLAREMYPQDKALAKRYVSLARKIALRHRLPLGKKDFCRKCGTVFIPGRTLKVRLDSSKSAVLYTCISCNHTANFAYAKEKAGRRHQRR
ncbi:MAG: ribonuclease P [Candidatus Micrarchaeota archaeon]